jgi:hypothetical protein
MSFCRSRGRPRLGGSANQDLEDRAGLLLNQSARAGLAVTLGQKTRPPPELRGSQPPFTVPMSIGEDTAYLRVALA